MDTRREEEKSNTVEGSVMEEGCNTTADGLHNKVVVIFAGRHLFIVVSSL